MSAQKRKPKLNYKGLTAAEERRFRKEFTFGQTQIAECLGVDRRTVARWCLQGLPYKRGAHGKEHRIELSTAILSGVLWRVVCVTAGSVWAQMGASSRRDPDMAKRTSAVLSQRYYARRK